MRKLLRGIPELTALVKLANAEGWTMRIVLTRPIRDPWGPFISSYIAKTPAGDVEILKEQG